MKGKIIQILKSYDSQKDYGIPIQGRMVKIILSELESGKQYLLNDLVLKYNKKFNHKNLENTRGVFKNVMKKGKEIGIIKEVQVEPITFDNFCKLESVDYMRSQLKETKTKHAGSTIKHTGGGTRRAYSTVCWHFNNWIHGKKITTNQIIPTGLNKYEIKKITKKLDTIEDLLEVRKLSAEKDPGIIKFIKKYLLDDIHSHKSKGYMVNIYCGINAYFGRNDYEVKFHFDASVTHSDPIESLNGEELSLSLSDLQVILNHGRATLTDRATVLCKFHGGLDNITLTDRFNFEAWPQLVKWFGDEDHNKWDLKKCPAIVKLYRIKVNFGYNSMYDVDAISALQKYLDFREKKTGTKMKSDEPMLLNEKLQSITDRWVSDLIPKLAERAGNQRVFKILSGYIKEKKSHELRDLLKSTLLVCETMPYAADHVIGHKPRDSYEKQAILYPEKIRSEYMKASNTINIFSNITNYIKVDHEKEELLSKTIKNEQRLVKLEENQEQVKEHKSLDRINDFIQEKIDQIMTQKLSEKDKEIIELKKLLQIRK